MVYRTHFYTKLLKKKVGKQRRYIHLKKINLSKQKLIDNKKSISQIAYEMGFKYPLILHACLKSRWEFLQINKGI